MGQNRKDRITPYITHPARVAHMVTQFLNVPETYIYVAAGWLHDVMEDCSFLVNGEYSANIKNHSDENKDMHKFLIANSFISSSDGEEIFKVIEVLTQSQDKSILKQERKKDYYSKLLKSWYGPIIVKACDRIDNLLTVNVFTQDGYKWYLKDSANMIEVLGEDIRSISHEAFDIFEQTLIEAEVNYKRLYETI